MALPITVLSHGIWDAFHFGHLLHLQQARTFGDVLIVTLTVDRHVFKTNRPVFKQHQRVAMLRALAIVDEVRVFDDPGPEAPIRFYKPQIYVKGMEHIGKLKEQTLLESFGGKVRFTFDPGAPRSRTMKLLRHFANASKATQES